MNPSRPDPRARAFSCLALTPSYPRTCADRVVSTGGGVTSREITRAGARRLLEHSRDKPPGAGTT